MTQRHACVEQVLEWAAQHVAAHAAPGRFASDAEWRTAVNKRRDAAAPAPTFLQDLLQALAQVLTLDTLMFLSLPVQCLLAVLHLSLFKVFHLCNQTSCSIMCY